MAATDQKQGPDPLTHRSVTVTDPPDLSPPSIQPRRGRPWPLARLCAPPASNSSADDGKSSIERLAQVTARPGRKPALGEFKVNEAATSKPLLRFWF